MDRNVNEIKQNKIHRLEKGDPIFLFDRVVVTHKTDGTNARLIWDGDELHYGSKNVILNESNKNKGFRTWAQENVNEERFRDHFNDIEAVVFGEFFKDSILGRVKYGENPRLRVHDVHINKSFLDWPDVVDVSKKLNLKPTKYWFEHGLNDIDDFQELVEDYRDPYALDSADENKKIGEGVVVRPPQELKTKTGNRIIYKVKSSKFEEIKKVNSSSNKSKKDKFDDEDIELVDKYITESRIHSVVQSLRGQNPDFKISKRTTGDVIQETIQDIRDESRNDELNEKALGKYGGSKIAEKYHDMINTGKFLKGAEV